MDVIFFLILALAIVFLIYKAIEVRRKKQVVEAGVSLAEDAHLRHAIESEIKNQFSGEVKNVGEFTKTVTDYVQQAAYKHAAEKTKELRAEFNKAMFEKNKEVEEKTKSLDIAMKEVKVIGAKYDELDTSFKELGEEKKQTEEIIHSMAEGVIMVNKKGEIMLMNPAAEKLLGVKKGEGVGKSVLNDLKEEQVVSMALQSDADAKNKEIVIESQNASAKKILMASNAVIESEDGKTVGFVSVLSDVTKQKEVEKLKNEFLANVSHDLRTPLTCVKGTLQLLADPNFNTLTEWQGKQIDTALRNIDRLSRLVNDLLDLSKLEAQKFVLRHALFPVEDLIDAVVRDFEAWSKEKGIALRTDVESKLDLVADPDRITQVLNNLMGNAFKFTPKGGMVTISAKRSADLTKIEFAVQDTGLGIAKNDFIKLFEKFSRIESKAMQGVSGTGLGLTIAKEIVELHQGRIWIESEEGKGSRFVFEVPTRQNN